MAEQIVDFPWPVHGVNNATATERQPPGTSPDAQNVRTYEPSTSRARGGSRPGLSRYIDAQVLGTASAIQNISVVAFMTTDAVGSGFLYGAGPNPDVSQVTVDVGPDVSWGDWPRIRSNRPVDFQTATDPSSGTRNYGRIVRAGGDGWMQAGVAPVLGLPEIDSIMPPSGSISGVVPVTITGSNLAPTTSVTFGGVAGTIVSSNATTIVVTPPATAASTVAVVVHTPKGGSVAGSYTFDTVPRISGLSISTFSVNATIAGTTAVITGTDLGSATVTFGGVSATVNSNTSTSINVSVPSNTAGNYFVNVVTAGGSSLPTVGAAIIYGLPFEYPIPLPSPYTGAYFTAQIGSNIVLPGDTTVLTVHRSLDGSTNYDSASVTLTRDPTEDPTFNLGPGSFVSGLNLLTTLNGAGISPGVFKEET